MIGFQGPAAVVSQAQQQQPSQTTGPTSDGPPQSQAATGGAGRGCQQQMSRQLQQQHCHHHQLSLLTTNQSQRDDIGSEHEPAAQRSIGASSSLSPSPTSGASRKGSSHASRRVSSPGYHSAASSPGSSVSSSAASSASSSGVSSASSDNQHQRPVSSPTCSLSTSANSTSNALMMALTTNSTAQQQQNQRHLNQAQNHNNQNKRPFGSQTITCTTASIMSSPQVARLSLNHNHHQHQDNPNRAISHQDSSGCNPPTLLDYYPEARQDGLNLSWFHAANSRQQLGKALVSERAIVAGDISLAELSRYPVPIMARPPLGSSDLTLENWLTEVIQARKGIKLTFTSTRTVEPAFRVLARHADHLKGPIILSADILTRPTGAASGQSDKSTGAKQQPVDAWTFLMLCRTRFPKSIISIGWCSSAGPQQQQQLELNTRQSDSAGESMFELDMMLDQQPANPTQHHPIHFNPTLLNLSTSQRVSDNLNSLHVVQQLAAAAAAAAASNNHLDHSSNNNHNHLLSNHHHPYHVLHTASVQQQQQKQRNQHANYTLSSTGSLTSSSGNSSGSPSPTSPIGHMLLNHKRHQLQQMGHNHTNVHSNHHLKHLQHTTSSAEQLMFAAAAAAAAAASADADGPKLSHHHHQLGKQTIGGRGGGGWPSTSVVFKQEMIDEEDEEREIGVDEEEEEEEEEEEVDERDDNSDECHQLPLNLNINEADPQHAAAAAAAAVSSNALRELAKQIKSFQRQQQSSNALNEPNGHQPAALSLTKRLFSTSGANQIETGLFNQHSKTLDSATGNKWEHISKKAALANRLNSNSPSPVPTSPKHHQIPGQSQNQNNLLCVRPNLSQQRPQTAPRQLAQTTPKQSANCPADQLVGYTREMIDKMASLVKEYNLTQPITFSVEARLLNSNGQTTAGGANNSLGELQRLLYQVGSNSSLTVVAQPEDLISVEDLLTIRKHFATNQILFDLPDELAASLRQELELH